MSKTRFQQTNTAIWQCALLKREKILIHGFSTRLAGVSRGPFRALNLGLKGGDHEELVFQNRSIFYKTLNLGVSQVQTLQQVHGRNVLEITGDVKDPMQRESADAMVTSSLSIVLAIMAADCAVLFFYDPEGPAVGLAHAGWKGTLKGISVAVLKKMSHLYGSKAGRVKVAVSPAIGLCCYEIQEDLLQSFLLKWPREIVSFRQSKRKLFLNIKEINRRQLVSHGVAPRNIFISRFCTACLRKCFYSYRRDGKKTGSMMGVISLSGEPVSYAK